LYCNANGAHEMAAIQEINSTIMFGNLSNDELDSIIAAIKFRRGQLTREVKRGLTVGSKVKFYSTKRGQTYQGIVEKVAVKFITVNCGTMRWRVPANMLEVL